MAASDLHHRLVWEPDGRLGKHGRFRAKRPPYPKVRVHHPPSNRIVVPGVSRDEFNGLGGSGFGCGWEG